MRISNEVNLVCARDPQPGDWWHEMLCAACLVIDRDGDRVRVCRTKRHFEDSWQWARAEWMSVAEFGRWLRYEHLSGKFWADYVGRNRRDAEVYRQMFADEPEQDEPEPMTALLDPMDVVGIAPDRLKRLAEYATEDHHNYGNPVFQPTPREIRLLVQLATDTYAAFDDMRNAGFDE